MVCVAIASYAQNLTGFAFSLILLGTVAMLDIVPITEVANAAMLLSLVNAWSHFRIHRVRPPWRLMRPVIVSSIIGVATGVALLSWLSGNALEWLRLLLGVCILGCALVLILQTHVRNTPSSPSSFMTVGFASGILGGLFSSSGPPLVFHMYRQPMDHILVRNCLLVVFAVGAVFRLALIIATGQLSVNVLLLSACAMPVVYFVTRLNHRFPSRAKPATLRLIVAILLVFSGSTLLVAAVRAVVF
ncbi:sulfite exporter TauE/SafE family protein [Alcaligenaceae bacterium]|nr:sulfite exporter TauE/SafE family protein [Alcaligenaceae bacterium]